MGRRSQRLSRSCGRKPILVVLVAAVVVGCAGREGKVDGDVDTTDAPQVVQQSAPPPMCETLQLNLDRLDESARSSMRDSYRSQIGDHRGFLDETENFRIEYSAGSPREVSFANWYCEFVERFPKQASLIWGDDWNYMDQKFRTLFSSWGAALVIGYFKSYTSQVDEFNPPGILWDNEDTLSNDVLPECGPGLGLRTPKFPYGITMDGITASPEDVSPPVEYAGAIRAIREGTFQRYVETVQAELDEILAWDYLMPPLRTYEFFNPSSPGTYSWGVGVTGAISQPQIYALRVKSALIDAANLLYVKYKCPEVWSALGYEIPVNEFLNQIDHLISFADAGFSQFPYWLTPSDIPWSASLERQLAQITGCNFESLTFSSLLNRPDLKTIGFECGTSRELEAPSLTRFDYVIAGPSFLYVYPNAQIRLGAQLNELLAGSESEYSAQFCGEIRSGREFGLAFQVKFKSAEVWQKKWKTETENESWLIDRAREMNFQEC